MFFIDGIGIVSCLCIFDASVAGVTPLNPDAHVRSIYLGANSGGCDLGLGVVCFRRVRTRFSDLIL